MFLDYFALVILIVGLLLVFYTFIYIHEIPHKIALKNGHPYEEAIGVAGWLSLFTLHAIWPIVFIWAMAHKKPTAPTAATDSPSGDANRRIADLEARLRALENAK